MVNANPCNYLLYFGHLPVFLITTGNREGKMSNDPEFKRKTYQALDTGNLSH
mgnify:CR=1 FL=1|jgi:hypothetical protein